MPDGQTYFMNANANYVCWNTLEGWGIKYLGVRLSTATFLSVGLLEELVTDEERKCSVNKLMQKKIKSREKY